MDQVFKVLVAKEQLILNQLYLQVMVRLQQLHLEKPQKRHKAQQNLQQHHQPQLPNL